MTNSMELFFWNKVILKLFAIPMEGTMSQQPVFLKFAKLAHLSNTVKIFRISSFVTIYAFLVTEANLYIHVIRLTHFVISKRLEAMEFVLYEVKSLTSPFSYDATCSILEESIQLID